MPHLYREYKRFTEGPKCPTSKHIGGGLQKVLKWPCSQTHGERLTGGEIKFCPTELKIAGQCGIKGGWDCFLAINAKVGASGMAMNCSCQPLPSNERNCKCMVVCRD
ncbi:hypothetical protein PVK06_034896 [Gossypium arboreum]|uniref:Uncharacterized protein n=1 Tax=Gossypium arboreum TaxID=29729 RepID=A0ABR0NFZ2_GOSAR|nr:hypothetical protein PVK06_034896 [Gossypium arboreum]